MVSLLSPSAGADEAGKDLVLDMVLSSLALLPTGHTNTVYASTILDLQKNWPRRATKGQGHESFN